MLRWIAHRLGQAVGSIPNAKAATEPQIAATKAYATRSFNSKLAGVTAKIENGHSRQD